MKETDYDVRKLLDIVVWYNGLADTVLSWKKPGVLRVNNGGSLGRKYEEERKHLSSEDIAQLEMIWMICVYLFGDYGTSPRSGWIEDIPAFHQFIDDITKTERVSYEYRVERT